MSHEEEIGRLIILTRKIEALLEEKGTTGKRNASEAVFY